MDNLVISAFTGRPATALKPLPRAHDFGRVFRDFEANAQDPSFAGAPLTSNRGAGRKLRLHPS